jgi:dolichol-phosphate mannosyltransferase
MADEDWRLMIYFVIPAYNEEGNIGVLVERISDIARKNDLDYSIVVIDDGSTDTTPQVLRDKAINNNIVILENKPNAGLGKTMAKGLKHAVEVSAQGDVIVTLDGDATHDPEYVPTMLAKLNEGFDVVIASRFAPGGFEQGLAVYRKILSRGSGAMLKFLFPIKEVQDYTSGYRMFKASIIKSAFERFGDGFVKEIGFSVTPEILLKLRLLGAKIGEVGFTLKYDEKIGTSKIKVSQTIVQYLKMIARFKRDGY